MKIILILLTALTLTSALPAEIIKTTQIEDILPAIEQDTLVFFNIAEVLMDNETSLGSAKWRRFVREHTPSMHDKVTFYVASNLPFKTPEPQTAPMIRSLQEKGVAVMAFTSRGRHEWYSTQMEGIDTATEQWLGTLGIDFTQSRLPEAFVKLGEEMADYYHAGIIYATNGIEKGDMLRRMLTVTGYRPSKIVFIDDKADSLKTVEKTLEELGIPFQGFAYGRTAENHKDFDQSVANVQLMYLLTGRVLSDAEATDIAKGYVGSDPADFLQHLLRHSPTLQQ